MLKTRYSTLYNLSRLAYWIMFSFIIVQYIFDKKKFRIQFVNFDYDVYPGLIFGSIMTVLTFYLTYKLYTTRIESENYRADMWSLAWYLFNSSMFLIIGFLVFIQNA